LLILALFCYSYSLSLSCFLQVNFFLSTKWTFVVLTIPFFCWKERRRYRAEGAVPRGSKIGAGKYGKDMQRRVFDFACIRHPCWRGWGMLYIY
jgi:hypothetical protein